MDQCACTIVLKIILVNTAIVHTVYLHSDLRVEAVLEHVNLVV